MDRGSLAHLHSQHLCPHLRIQHIYRRFSGYEVRCNSASLVGTISVDGDLAPTSDSIRGDGGVKWGFMGGVQVISYGILLAGKLLYGSAAAVFTVKICHMRLGSNQCTCTA